MGSESSMKQAAERLGESLQRIFRKVQRMLELGLLEKTRLEARVGRGIQYYQAVSDTFFIRFLDQSFEEVLLEHNLNFEQRFVAAVAQNWRKYAPDNRGWGTTYFRAASGKLVAQAPVFVPSDVPVPTAPAVFSHFSQWHLHAADADALLNDLTALVARYAAKNVADEQAFLVRVAMSPVLESP